MMVKRSMFHCQCPSNVFFLLLLVGASSGDLCPDFNCYIEQVADEKILDCDYRINLQFLNNYRLIKCEFDAKRNEVFLSASAADDSFVNRIAHGMFKRLSAVFSEIEELVISHIKVSTLTRSDFNHLGKLKVLTLMKPDSIEEDSFIDIVNPKYFQFYVYCVDNDVQNDGFTALRIPSTNWRIIIRNCAYTAECMFGTCFKGIELQNESYIKFTSNRDFIAPEMVFYSSSCFKLKRICPISFSRTTNHVPSTVESTSTTLFSTNGSTDGLLRKRFQGDVNQDNSPEIEKIGGLTSPGEMSQRIIIIIIVITVNVALVLVLIGLAVYRYRQVQDRKPCRGKHTIVLN